MPLYDPMGQMSQAFHQQHTSSKRKPSATSAERRGCVPFIAVRRIPKDRFSYQFGDVDAHGQRVDTISINMGSTDSGVGVNCA